MTDPRFDLHDRLTAAAAELRMHAPPATLLPAMLRALAPREKPRAPSRLAAWLRWSALAGGTTLAALVVALLVPQEDGELSAASAVSSGFMGLGDTDAWTQAVNSGATPAWLLATEMPQSRLAALGLPYDPARAGERMPAQLLVQPSGDVLAVRIAR